MNEEIVSGEWSEYNSLLTAKVSELKNTYDDHEEIYTKKFKYNEYDVGLKNPHGDSRIKLYKDGDIEIFTGNEAGIIISKENNSTSLFGESINIISDAINLKTKDIGLVWNGYSFNSQLRTLCDKPSKDKMGNLSMYCSVEMYCPGTPNQTCGNTKQHSPHFFSKDIALSPYVKQESKSQTQLEELVSKYNIKMR